jgi:predicted anti-sigma-YlaC factor YlaD
MNCQQVREYLFDLDTGQAPAAAEEHLRSCSACAAELAALRRTMSLLDAWQTPEPSPYFDTRLRARLREQAPLGWWQTLRRPAMALALTLIVAMGVMIHGTRALHQRSDFAILAPPGTAVGDLQSLDKNRDLLANIELLDEVSYDQNNQVNQ